MKPRINQPPSPQRQPQQQQEPAEFKNPYDFETHKDFVNYQDRLWQEARTGSGADRARRTKEYRDWMVKHQTGAIRQNHGQFRTNRMRYLLSNEADDFRNNIDDYKQDRVEGLLPTYRLAQEEGTRKVREGASRRGLLYSGLAQKEEGELRSNLGQEFAQQKKDINVEAETLARKKEFAASAAGLDQALRLMGEAENYYNISMQNQAARRRALGSLFGGIGYGVGSFMGGRESGGNLNLEGSSSLQMPELGSQYGSTSNYNLGG